MFGTRPHVKDFELTIPHSLYENWADCFQDHELSVRLGKSGNLVHIERSTNRASDNASIDKNNNSIHKAWVEQDSFSEDFIFFSNYSNGQVFRKVR